MNPPDRKIVSGEVAAFRFGAEWKRNPGSSRSDYMNDAAGYYGSECFADLSDTKKKELIAAFNAGAEAETRAV